MTCGNYVRCIKNNVRNILCYCYRDLLGVLVFTFLKLDVIVAAFVIIVFQWLSIFPLIDLSQWQFLTRPVSVSNSHSLPLPNEAQTSLRKSLDFPRIIQEFLIFSASFRCLLLIVYFDFSVDCFMPNCSGHGVCIDAQCHCDKGYTGSDCSIPDVINITEVCAKNCSGHGTFDMQMLECRCEDGWTGNDCEEGQWELWEFFYFLVIFIFTVRICMNICMFSKKVSWKIMGFFLFVYLFIYHLNVRIRMNICMYSTCGNFHCFVLVFGSSRNNLNADLNDFVNICNCEYLPL